MSKIHGRNTRVYINGYDLSTYFTSAEPSTQIETAETTGFSDTEKSYLVGLKNGALKLQGFLDTTDGDGVLESALAADTDPIVNVLHGPLIDQRGEGAVAKLTSLGRTAPIGGIVSMNADFMAQGGIKHTNTVQAKGTLGTVVPGGTTSVYNGGSDTAFGAIGFLQIFQVISGTPVVVIEHSEDGSSSWGALITFAAQAGIGAQEAAVTGTVKPYKRTTVTGGSAVLWTGINQPLA